MNALFLPSFRGISTPFRGFLTFLCSLLLCLFPPALHAQITFAGPASSVNFGSANVCPNGQRTPAPCSQTMTLNYNIGANVTLGTPRVLTGGASNLDFILAQGSTCAGTVEAAVSCTVNVTFAPILTGPREGAVVLQDGSGNILATTYIYGMGMGPQVVFLPGVQSVLANGYGYPEGVAVDGSGDIYIADYSGGTVYKETPSANGYTRSIVGNGFSGPIGVAVDGSGNVYVADLGASAVYKETPAQGSYIQSMVGSGLSEPSDVAVDGSGNVYVADLGQGGVYFAGTVYKETLSGDGYTQSTVATGFSAPRGVAVDGSGNVYVTQYSGTAIYKETPSEGSYTQSILDDGFIYIEGIVVDSGGDIYFCYRGVVYKLTPFGDSYTQSIVGSFNTASYVAVDGSGNIYVTDLVTRSLNKLDISDPPSLSFTSTGAASAMSVQIDNIGNVPLALEGDELAISSNWVLQLYDDSSNTLCLNAVFTPQSDGPLTGTITITDNNLNAAAPNYAVQTIPLSGIGEVGQLSVPSPITIPAIPAGNSEVVDVAVSNIGTAPLSFTASIVGPNFILLYNARNTCNSTLAVGKSCNLPLSFQPPGVGRHTVPLYLTPTSGTAVVTNLQGLATGIGDISESPLNFGTIPYGTTKTLPLTIQNFGVAGSPTIAVSFNNPSYSLASGGACVTTGVAAGQTCTLMIKYAPVGHGVHNAGLTISPSLGAASIVKLQGATIPATAP